MATFSAPPKKHKDELDEIFRYNIDNSFHESIQSLYSRALDRAGLNVKDPIESNLRFFNKTHSLGLVDPPFVGKTYIFMTRPMLNLFDVLNLKRVGFFEYCMHFKLGRLCLLQLQHERAQILPLSEFNLAERYDDIAKLRLPTCFMPMISNFCTDTSGAKDLTMETKETEGDYSGNKLVYATGADETWTTGEITLNFKDAKYNPILLLHYIWFMYIHYTCKGTIYARVEHIMNKIIDYTSSIYIFMTDETQSNIVRWVRYMGCFPKNVPFGQIQHKVDIDPMSLRDFSITYSYNRYEVNEIRSITDFNTIAYEYVFKMQQDDPNGLINSYRQEAAFGGAASNVSGKKDPYGDSSYRPKNRANRYSDVAYNGGEIRDDPDTTFNKFYGVPKHFLNDLAISDYLTENHDGSKLMRIPERFIKDPLKEKTDEQGNFYNRVDSEYEEESIRKLEMCRNRLDYLAFERMKRSDPEAEFSHVYKRHPYIYKNHIIFV